MLYLLILRESQFDNNVEGDHSVRVVLEEAGDQSCLQIVHYV